MNVYTEHELEYCYSLKRPAQHLAVRFCAKEAIFKALSTANFKKIPIFCQIEITNESNGAPKVNFLDPELSKSVNCKITLSHCKDKAIAFVILELLKS